MARSQDLAKLVVRLEAETARYQKELDQARGKLRRFDRQATDSAQRIARQGRAAAAAATLATGAVATLAARQASAIRETDALAQSVGVSTGTLQEFQFAGERVGLSAEKMGDIFKDTSDKLGDFVATGGGEAADLFEKLNLDADKLIKLSPDKQLVAIGDAISQLDDRSQQVFFLESIADDASRLLPLLENDAKLLRQLQQEARDLGIALPEEDIQSILRGQVALERLQGATTGFINQATVALAESRIPQIIAAIATDTGSSLEKNQENVVDWAESVGRYFAFAADAARGAGNLMALSVETAGTAIGGAAAVLMATLEGDAERADRLRDMIGEDLEAIFDQRLNNFDPNKARDAFNEKLEFDPIESNFDPGDVGGGGAGQAASEAVSRRAEEIARIREAAAAESEKLRQAELDRRDAVDQVTQALETEAERARRIYDERETLIRDNVRDNEKRAELIKRNEQRLAEEIRRINEATRDQTSEFARQAARNIQDQLGDSVLQVLEGDFDSILGAWENMINRMVAEAAAAQLNEALLGNFGQSGDIGGLAGQAASALGGLFGGGGFDFGSVGAQASGVSGLLPTETAFAGIPGLAEGGIARGGEPHIVGEKGPELFVPNVTGRVVPNDEMGGGQPIVNIYTRDPDPRVEVRSRSVEGRRAHQSLQRARRSL